MAQKRRPATHLLLGEHPEHLPPSLPPHGERPGAPTELPYASWGEAGVRVPSPRLAVRVKSLSRCESAHGSETGISQAVSFISVLKTFSVGLSRLHFDKV